jgi:rod shape-determining protein MreC
MRKLWKNRPMWIAAVLFALCILLAAATVGDRRISYTDGLFRSAALPVQEKLYAAQEAVRDFFVRVFHPSALEEENARLKEQLLEQAKQLAFYEDTARENARLTELLNFTDANPNLRFLTASVIGKSSNPYIDTLTLNVGTRHGVSEKMAVITPDGIVGRVTEVGPNWCRVRTMCNDKMRISVMVERTRDEGMLGGLYEQDGEIRGTMLYYLPGNADLKVGDRIVTSGVGGYFPKGLYVGTVLSVNEEGKGTHDAIVSMEIDFLHLENALIVIGTDEAIE